jgi:hypothetical protein
MSLEVGPCWFCERLKVHLLVLLAYEEPSPWTTNTTV